LHGGKHYVAQRVLELMPPHLHYVEPYFGGGQVLFARDRADRRLWCPEPTSDGRKAQGVSEVINDIDGDLMNFYRVLKDPDLFGQLQHRLELTLHSEQEWQEARGVLDGDAGEPVERAAALFTCCRQSISGRMKDFAPTVRTRLRGGRNDGVTAWWNAIEGLEAVHQRLRDVKVLNRPALEVIRSEDTEATLFYLDPPYLHETRTATKVYRHEMTEADHRELLAVLLGCKGKVILSGYRNDIYDRALAGWRREEKELANHAAGGDSKRRMVECLWCN
jgi:DNA adenine methylase